VPGGERASSSGCAHEGHHAAALGFRHRTVRVRRAHLRAELSSAVVGVTDTVRALRVLRARAEDRALGRDVARAAVAHVRVERTGVRCAIRHRGFHRRIHENRAVARTVCAARRASKRTRSGRRPGSRPPPRAQGRRAGTHAEAPSCHPDSLCPSYLAPRQWGKNGVTAMSQAAPLAGGHVQPLRARRSRLPAWPGPSQGLLPRASCRRAWRRFALAGTGP
jgi:hypothetical protein